MVRAPWSLKRGDGGTVAVIGITAAAAVSMGQLDGPTHGNEPAPTNVEWIVVPDMLGQGQWLIGSNGDEYRLEDDDWITVDEEGVTLTVPWPWVHWRPLAGGRVTVVVGKG